MHVTNPERQLIEEVRSSDARPSLDWIAWVITEMTLLRPNSKRWKSMLWYASNFHGHTNRQIKTWLQPSEEVKDTKMMSVGRRNARMQFLESMSDEESSAFAIITTGTDYENT